METKTTLNSSFKLKLIHFFHRYINISIKEIALMAILLAVFTVIKYVTFIFFKGPLNFSVEILF